MPDSVQMCIRDRSYYQKECSVHMGSACFGIPDCRIWCICVEMCIRDRVFFRALCKADVSNDVLEVFDDDVTNAAGAVSEWLKSLH